MYVRRLLTAIGMIIAAFCTTWLLFHCWPEAQAMLKWKAWGIEFGTWGSIAVFFALLFLFYFFFWKPLAGIGGPPSGPKYPPQNPVPPIPDPGTGPAAKTLREGQSLYLRGYQLLAIEKYVEAIRLAGKDVKQRAYAQLGIAYSYSLLGQNSVARAYFDEARKLYQSMGMKDEANQFIGPDEPTNAPV